MQITKYNTHDITHIQGATNIHYRNTTHIFAGIWMMMMMIREKQSPSRAQRDSISQKQYQIVLDDVAVVDINKTTEKRISGKRRNVVSLYDIVPTSNFSGTIQLLLNNILDGKRLQNLNINYD